MEFIFVCVNLLPGMKEECAAEMMNMDMNRREKRVCLKSAIKMKIEPFSFHLLLLVRLALQFSWEKIRVLLKLVLTCNFDLFKITIKALWTDNELMEVPGKKFEHM